MNDEIEEDIGDLIMYTIIFILSVFLLVIGKLIMRGTIIVWLWMGMLMSALAIVMSIIFLLVDKAKDKKKQKETLK